VKSSDRSGVDNSSKNAPRKTGKSSSLALSRFFSELKLAYDAELDDLRSDSEGNNVLNARLTQKRQQVPQLLMMLQSNPEMVAVAFHGGITFKNTMALESLITKDVSKFPAWATLKSALVLEPWAQKLADVVLTDPEGATFLTTMAGLEYLNKSTQSRAASASLSFEYDDQSLDFDDRYEDENNDQSDNNESGHEEHYLDSDELGGDEGEDTEHDLDQAGADWLAGQGFDRKE
jgi:hypothetical protein